MDIMQISADLQDSIYDYLIIINKSCFLSPPHLAFEFAVPRGVHRLKISFNNDPPHPKNSRVPLVITVVREKFPILVACWMRPNVLLGKPVGPIRLLPRGGINCKFHNGSNRF